MYTIMLKYVFSVLILNIRVYLKIIFLYFINYINYFYEGKSLLFRNYIIV